MLTELKEINIQEHNEDLGNISPLIGREVYVSSSTIGPGEMRLLRRAYNWIGDSETARALEFRLHNNSCVASKDVFGEDRPASAYFTLLKDGTFVIEWGKINPNGEAKLHDFLNREVDYINRQKDGGVVRSGHLAYITVPGGYKVRVALLDCLLSEKEVDYPSSNYTIVSTLLKQGIVPLASNGRPVNLKGGDQKWK
ncbi:MAG TPA: hypothetical protein VF185_03530 [Patescibacteria group bacterium]